MEKSIKQVINLNSFMFLLLMRLSDSSDLGDIGCSPPWEQFYKSCVRFMKSKPFLNWQEARNSCRSMNSDLIRLAISEKRRKMKDLLTRHGNESTGSMEWWIGLRCVHGGLQWVNTSELSSYTTTTVTSGLGDTCGILNYRGNIAKTNCSTERMPYICEIKVLTTTKKPTIETTSDILPGDTSNCSVAMYIIIPVTVAIVGIFAVVILFVWKHAGRIHKNTPRKVAENEVEPSHVSVRIYDKCLSPEEASNQGNSNYITPVASTFDRRPGNAESSNKRQESSDDSRDKDVTAQSVNLDMFTTAHSAERAEYNYQQPDREETTEKHGPHTVERHVYHTVE